MESKIPEQKQVTQMYSYNNKTEAISARLAPGLKGRIDFECAQYRGWNRNKFINCAAGMLLDLRQEVRCGNLNPDDLPSCMRRYAFLLT